MAGETAPTAAIIRLPGDKRLFVAGMYWRHEDRMPGRQQLLRGARGRDFWTTVRRTANRSVQSGFCAPVLDAQGKPQKGKLVSLAATVAEVLQEPWLGIFDLGDGRYWYVAVRDNYEILPDGDVIGDYDTVERIRREHAGYGEWTVFIDGGVDRIIDLVRKAKRQWLVRDVRQRPWVLPVLGMAALGAAGTVGLTLLHRHEATLEQERAAAMQRRMEVLRAMAAQQAAANVPWLQSAAPSDFLAACAHAVADTPLSVDGWILRGVLCAQQGAQQGVASIAVSALWARGEGATTLYRPAGQIDARGERIIGSALSLSAPVATASRLDSLNAASALLYGQAQSLGITVDVDVPADPAQHALPGAQEKPAARGGDALWKPLQVRLSGPAVVLLDSGAFWDAVPGLRLERLVIGASATKPGDADGASGTNPDGAGDALDAAQLMGTLYVKEGQDGQ